jgi:ATP/maltotriose-dependent transcriptional regulator MalT
MAHGEGVALALASVTCRRCETHERGGGLVAAGRTDREITEALFISRRTASKHVGNLLRKLGARSRADAAACAVRHGLA